MKRFALFFAFTLLTPHRAEAIDIPLLCANKQSFELRMSNVISRCTDFELSLGEGPLLYISLPTNRVNANLEARFLAAQAAAKKEGVTLKIVSGYRSLSRQQFLFNQAVKRYGSELEAAKWVSPAEVSKHPLGLAIDINYPNDPRGASWLEINGSKFGLCRVYENEWWHFEGIIAPGAKCPKLIKDPSVILNLKKSSLGT
jgi:LAS superfamily LD-carboxypeptidase LdcB